MVRDRIDFISAYCDGWCERCPFTLQCSAFAVEIATTMCDGDIEAAIELAVGQPRSVEESVDDEAEWPPELLDPLLTDSELAEIVRGAEERDRRVRESPLLTIALGLTRLMHGWLEARRDRVMENATPLLAGAIEVAGWDCHLIAVKLHRALAGRARSAEDEGWDDHPVQNDWNGSAKVALISIERSAVAWSDIAAVTGDPEPRRLAEELLALQDEVNAAFPDARRFVRPGFDEP